MESNDAIAEGKTLRHLTKYFACFSLSRIFDLSMVVVV